ncbi:MAG: tRNA 4-thiouridine(8) synthase ThiI, partial [Clostridia bacterium]|nr:tRNA 4-thiouridine(8) synthase ThiI [Clostridia bacterium]
MKKIIIARYAEIYLKGKNIAFFESRLKKNIEKALEEFNVKVKILRCRYQISDYDEFDENEIIDRLKKVFGIHSISTCYVVKSTLENLQNAAKEMIDFEG